MQRFRLILLIGPLFIAAGVIGPFLGHSIGFRSLTLPSADVIFDSYVQRGLFAGMIGATLMSIIAMKAPTETIWRLILVGVAITFIVPFGVTWYEISEYRASIRRF